MHFKMVNLRRLYYRMGLRFYLNMFFVDAEI